MNKIAIFMFGLLVMGILNASAYEDITPEEVYQRMGNGDDMVIVDVRESYEYESGYIPGAINLPWNSGVLQNDYEKLLSDIDIIVVCRSGNRSVSASIFLDNKGFQHVYNMLGGMRAWEWEIAVPTFGMHHYGSGWIYRNTGDTTFIHCPTDTFDWLEFPPGGMMHHHFPDSIYCLFEEIHPDSMPWPYDSTMFWGYHIEISNPMGHGMMAGGHMGFQQGIGLHLHYDDEMLANRYEEGLMLHYWDEDGGQWIDVPGVMHDIDENTITLTQNPLQSYYGLFATPASQMSGDVNADGATNITDVVTVINFILKTEQPTEEQFRIADLNGDEVINIIDVLHLVNILLGTSPKAQEQYHHSEAFLEIQQNLTKERQKVTVPILLKNEIPVSGLQFSLIFDSHSVKPGSPVAVDRASHMMAAFRSEKDRIHFVLYSTAGEQILPGSGPIVEIPFEQREGTDGYCEFNIEGLALGEAGGGAIEAGASGLILLLSAGLPQSHRLLQNYPNPFNPRTDIRYQIAESDLLAHTSLKIYNILGQEIRTLVDQAQEPGYYTVTWDGRDDTGRQVASGFYFYRLSAGEFTATKSMVLLK
jgi:rhodanese-related sulfurtransferase